jgi:cell division protein FtsB
MCELCAFGIIYTFGPQGYQKLMMLQKESGIIKNEIASLHSEVNQLEVTIAQWHAEPFFKEQIAREQLQMARKNETIYYLS